MAIAEESTASGISFALTDEQSDLRALAHEFADKEIRPVAAGYDEHQTHPADVIAKAHELGLMNVHIPQELGGPGLSIFDGILIGEELSWGCSGIAVSLVANTLGSAPVLLAGTDEQKQTWLPPLLEEPLLCSFALTEPNAGSDVSGIQTTAERHGDEYVLNGSKMFISNAGHAAWIVVFASTDRSKAQRGLSAFVVPADTEGVDRREAPRQDGPARDRHLRARAPGREGAGGEPARRGGRRLQDRDADARPHAARAPRSGRSESRGRPTSCPSSTRANASSSDSRSR